MTNVCSNKQKCHTSFLYPAIHLWSALKYSVYCTIIRILQSFVACFLLTKYSFQFRIWLIAYCLSQQTVSRFHGKDIACRCSVWYAACNSLLWHCCHHYWASQTKSRFRTGESGNWHYGNPLDYLFHQLIEKSSPQIWSQESGVVYSIVMIVHRYPN